MMPRSTKLKCNDSKIFTMDVNAHDFCYMCTNYDFVLKLKVYPPLLTFTFVKWNPKTVAQQILNGDFHVLLVFGKKKTLLGDNPNLETVLYCKACITTCKAHCHVLTWTLKIL